MSASSPPPRPRAPNSAGASRTLDDAHARADPEGAALAAWSLVHGFSMLWLNDAVDRTDDPIATIERLALMLFDG